MKFDETVDNLSNPRFINKSDEHYPHDAFNQKILDELIDILYSIEAHGNVPEKFKYPASMIHAAQNQKEISTGGLTNLLRLRIRAKAVLNINIDIQHCLING